MDIKLKVYDEDMETVKKECAASTVKIPFGLVRKLMNLFKVETLEDTTQIINIVMTRGFFKVKSSTFHLNSVRLHIFFIA